MRKRQKSLLNTAFYIAVFVVGFVFHDAIFGVFK